MLSHKISLAVKCVLTWTMKRLEHNLLVQMLLSLCFLFRPQTIVGKLWELKERHTRTHIFVTYFKILEYFWDNKKWFICMNLAPIWHTGMCLWMTKSSNSNRWGRWSALLLSDTDAYHRSHTLPFPAQIIDSPAVWWRGISPTCALS